MTSSPETLVFNFGWRSGSCSQRLSWSWSWSCKWSSHTQTRKQRKERAFLSGWMFDGGTPASLGYYEMKERMRCLFDLCDLAFSFRGQAFLDILTLILLFIHCIAFHPAPNQLWGRLSSSIKSNQIRKRKILTHAKMTFHDIPLPHYSLMRLRLRSRLLKPLTSSIDFYSCDSGGGFPFSSRIVGVAYCSMGRKRERGREEDAIEREEKRGR